MEIIPHLLVLILFPPLLLGVINKTKALFAGRTGAPLLQPYFDIVKLLRKGMVLSGSTTWVFRAGPLVAALSVLCAGFLIPLGSAGAPVSFAGDFILFAYLFALARFMTTLAALDTGSAFEGMGVSRELTFAFLSEPALFFALLVLARNAGSLRLDAMLLGPLGGIPASSLAPFVLVGLGLFIVLLAETCRIPVD
ncbi:MAG TPA: NADH-quinone oxidoreductase subunit H, partial [Rectinemataceae bacterium]|nr:NADH-quinone oxidoreductase subunit H [Rectinemataceae bacterium]